MNKKEALDLINALIEQKKAQNPLDDVKAIFAQIKSTYMEDLKKSISEGNQAIEKLSKAEGAPAPMKPAAKPTNVPKMPAKPKLEAPAPMAKIDPKTRLPGVMLDKSSAKSELAQRMKKCMSSMSKADGKSPAVDPNKAKSFQQGFNAGGPSISEMGSNLANAFGFGKTEKIASLGVAEGKSTGIEANTKQKNYEKKSDEANVPSIVEMEVKKADQKGVHKPVPQHPGISGVGADVRVMSGGKKNSIQTVNSKILHQEKLKELKSMPKPNLPKSEDLNKDGMTAAAPGSRLDAGFGKVIVKDDSPHPANSPEDKAHDAAEGSSSIPESVHILDNNREMINKMFEHLRSRKDNPNWNRSAKNRKIGEEK